MKQIIKLYFIPALTFLIACNSQEKEEKIEGYKSNEIIVVTLDIEANNGIEKITLTSNGGQDSILKNEIGSKTRIKLKCPQKGEGTFDICVYTINDTLSSISGYAEGGFKPTFKLKNNKFETIKWL